MTSAPMVARFVAAGLDRTAAAIDSVPVEETWDATEYARRAERLHQLYTRRARWWAVLERAGIDDPAIPTVYLRAVVQARCTAENHAADWASTGERWTGVAKFADARGVAELVEGVAG